MSDAAMISNLLVELSTDEQQLLAGGFHGRRRSDDGYGRGGDLFGGGDFDDSYGLGGGDLYGGGDFDDGFYRPRGRDSYGGDFDDYGYGRRRSYGRRPCPRPYRRGSSY